MGLIKSIINATTGTLGDQWVDFFTCDSMDSDTLVSIGTRPSQAKSGNHSFSENIITNGAKINVADGQCMLICENGKIVDFCAEPGQYVYDTDVQPSLLAGGFRDLGATFQQIGKRFLAGGAPTDEQKIYYVNTKEIFGNKIGFANIPFRDSEFQFTVKVRGFGEYTFKISNPLLFYKEIVGNISTDYTKEALLQIMKAEVMNTIQPALGKIAAQRIAYDQLINYPDEIGTAVDEVLSNRWGASRGIEITVFAIESITISDEDAAKIAQFQESRIYSNQQMAAGFLTTSTGEAMQNAASNSGGAMQGFLGMGMAQGQMSGMGLQNMFQNTPNGTPVAPTPAPTPAPSTPVASASAWTCGCGNSNESGFCSNCGSKKPVAETVSGWACTCGASNMGKFCSTCGTKKPAAAAQYQCDKCKWTPADMTQPPKFCPECGDPFDNDDVIS